MTTATHLLTDDGDRLPLGKRTGAVMMEVYARQEAIERPRKGRVEISIDFSNGGLTVAVREVGECRRIE